MPVLFVTVAKPGHGKSFVSRYVRDLCGANHIRSDVVRKEEVAEGDPTYSSEESGKTYDLLFKKAKRSLEEGNHVILDATFNKKSGRERAERISKETGSKVLFIEVKCDSDVAKERIRNRDGVSDADVDLYEDFRIEPLSHRDTFVVDNSGSMDRTKDQVEQMIREITSV